MEAQSSDSQAATNPLIVGAEGAVRTLLTALGEDPQREGLLDTPSRVVRALREMTVGYSQDPKEILSRIFDAEQYDEMIIVRGVRFTSLCEHHVLPFTGTVNVGYVPKNKVVGLSKLARLVECYSRRLQIQERMTYQIASAVMEYLQPLGVGVIVTARHSCMGHRGARQPDADMITSAMLGVFREKQEAREEFLRLCKETH